MRQEHYLKPAAGDALPSLCIAVFAELGQQGSADAIGFTRDIPQAIYACSWRSTPSGTECEQNCQCFNATSLWCYVQSCMRKKTTAWLFMVNAKRQLAALGFFDLLEQGEWQLTNVDPYSVPGVASCSIRPWHGYAVLEDPPTVILCRPTNGNGTLRIVDVRNYGVKDLDSLPPADMPHIRIANFADELIRFIRDNALGSLQPTAGSQAMYTFRRKYLKHMAQCHANEEVLRLEERAFFGGRTECRYIGEVLPFLQGKLAETARRVATKLGYEYGPIWHLDFNSLYPSVCVGALVPLRLCSVWDGKEMHGARSSTYPLVRIADVLLQTDCPAFPVRHGNAVIYPIGCFWTTLAEPELVLAEQMGAVLSRGMVAYYESEEALSCYMHDLYAYRVAARQSGKQAEEQLIKAMLVALPGKFAQLGRRWIDAPQETPQRPWEIYLKAVEGGNRAERFRSIAWWTQREEREGFAYDAVPSIAAFITSASRVSLWRAITVCQPMSVYYYDTDSLWVNEAGLQALDRNGYLDELALGKLKVVARHERVEFRGLKHYVADGQLVCAGYVPNASVKQEGTITYSRSLPINADLAKCRAPEPGTYEFTVSTRKGYRHGKVDKYGWVSPLTVNDATARQPGEEG